MERLIFSRRPAACFEEAYPIGNGRLGAMVYGGKEERLSLNDDTLWSGYGKENPAPAGAPENFCRARALVEEGKIAEAEELLASGFHAMWSQMYLPLGDLFLVFSNAVGEASADKEEYLRSLDIADALARVETGGRSRTYFVSYPDDALVVRLTDREAKLSFSASLKTPHLVLSQTAEDGMLILNGRAPSNGCNYPFVQEKPVLYDGEHGMTFSVALKIETDGKLSPQDGVLTVEGATEAVIYLTSKTSFCGFDRDPSGFSPPEDRVRAILAPLSLANYGEILKRHLADVRELLGRTEFTLEGRHSSDITTEERLKAFDGEDLGLYELLFAFGRYLTVASSRAGSQATNLQGIWNEQISPPWSSNYTININTEMNYWPTLPTSLPECYEPYIALAEKLAARGKKAAKDFYGAGGFVSHHNTDLWGMANPVGFGRTGVACVYSDFPFSSAWIASQIYDYYEYTLDRGALARIYPILAGACEFYLDMLTDDGKGGLIFSPATSPENRFVIGGELLPLAELDRKDATAPEMRFSAKENHSVARFTEAGQTLMRELFDRTLRAAKDLEISSSLTARVAEALPRLRKPAIGKDGRLLEWDGERIESEPLHRHLSHLIGVYPGETITKEKTPDLFAACEKSLAARGEDSSGWSLAWKACLASTFGDGERALRLLARQLRYFDSASYRNCMQGGGTFANFFDAHPPFQIDGNFGSTAAIANICLQSAGDRIEILPALPAAWRDGCVRGLTAKGNIRVDIAWKDGRATEISLLASTPCRKEVRMNQKTFRVSLEAGKLYTLTD